MHLVSVSEVLCIIKLFLSSLPLFSSIPPSLPPSLSLPSFPLLPSCTCHSYEEARWEKERVSYIYIELANSFIFSYSTIISITGLARSKIGNDNTYKKHILFIFLKIVQGKLSTSSLLAGEAAVTSEEQLVTHNI